MTCDRSELGTALVVRRRCPSVTRDQSPKPHDHPPVNTYPRTPPGPLQLLARVECQVSPHVTRRAPRRRPPGDNDERHPAREERRQGTGRGTASGERPAPLAPRQAILWRPAAAPWRTARRRGGSRAPAATCDGQRRAERAAHTPMTVLTVFVCLRD